MPIDTITLSNAIKTAYEKRLLTRAIPRYVHGRWAMRARISQYGSMNYAATVLYPLSVPR